MVMMFVGGVVADGKVRLLEVSLYAKGPRKGDVCPDVAFHEENASRYTWNNTPHPCVHEPRSRKSRQTKWINTLVVGRINLHSQVRSDLKSILMEQFNEGVI